MRICLISLIFVFTLLISFHSTIVHADTPRNALASVLENVKTYTLSNGLRVILYRRGDAPVFAGVVSVRVGGSDEVIGETGISHMFEHMAFKGTPEIGTTDYVREKKLLDELEVLIADTKIIDKLPAEKRKRWDEIQAELQKLWEREAYSKEYEKRGASGLNATTDKEITRYFVSLPRTAFEFWCWMESERLIHPVMRQFYQERDVVMEERRMRFEDDPDGKLYELLLSTIYHEHPYRNPVIGYAFDINSLTATALEKFRKRYYVPGNIAISVVGDIDPDTDIKTIEKYFAGIPAAPLPPRPAIVEPEHEGERRVTLEAKSSPRVYLAYPKPNYPDPDDPSISIMNEVLAGGRVSPLFAELVKNKRIASEIGVEETPGSAYPNVMMFYASVKTPHTNEDLIKAFDTVIANFLVNGVTQEQLEIAKRSVAMEYLGHLKSNVSLASDFSTAALIFDNWAALLDWYDRAMKVTTADVNRVARKYLVKRARTIGMLEPIKE